MWKLSENKSWEHLTQIFDWVRDMKNVQQDKIYHAEGNVDVHTQMVLDSLTNDSTYQLLSEQEKEILWASALLHDVEKRSTTVFEPDGSITSKGHSRKGAQTARIILYRDIPTPFDIREQISALVKYHSLPLWLLEKPDPLKTLISASLEVNTKWLALLARADVLGRICDDKNDLLYRVECFEEYCKEQNCWGTTKNFATSIARFSYLQTENSYVEYIPFENPSPLVILMSGLPGAGKDSYIKKQYDLPVISLDSIRQENKIKATDKTGNGQVIQLAKKKAKEYLGKNQSFVWNATNITRQMRSQLIDLFLSYKAKVKIVYIEVPYLKLKQQNSNREAIVPNGVLEKLVTKLEVPSLTEAHEIIYEIGK